MRRDPATAASGQSSWLGSVGNFLTGAGNSPRASAKAHGRRVSNGARLGNLAVGGLELGDQLGRPARQGTGPHVSKTRAPWVNLQATAITDPSQAASQVERCREVGRGILLSTAYRIKPACYGQRGRIRPGRLVGQGVAVLGQASALIPGAGESQEGAAALGDQVRIGEVAADLGRTDQARPTLARRPSRGGRCIYRGKLLKNAGQTLSSTDQTAAVRMMHHQTISRSKAPAIATVYRPQRRKRRHPSIHPERNRAQLVSNFGDEARAQEFLQQRLSASPTTRSSI